MTTWGARASRLAALACCAMLLPLSIAGVSAQPTREQQEAIRQSCRSDYMANCMSVKPGGLEALQCLQRNLGKLSPACRTAVNAAAPKAAPAGPAAAPTPASAPIQPASAPTGPASAAAASTPAETPAEAAPTSPPTPPKAPPAAATPSTAAAKAAPGPSSRPAAGAPAAPKERAKPPVPAAAAATPAPAAAPPVPTPAAAPIGAVPPRVLLAIMRACDADKRAVCPLERPGGGRIVACLVRHEAVLTPNCKQALAQARR